MDLFAGTGAVTQLFKHLGFRTMANDWQHYSRVTTSAFLKFNQFPRFETLAEKSSETGIIFASPSRPIKSHSIRNRRFVTPGEPCRPVLNYLAGLPGKPGPFYDAYCEGGSAGRLYFSRENGLKIQAIRDKIDEWRQQDLISDEESCWLIACLLESADRVANTTSVYGAYLKKIKRTANAPLKLIALRPIPSEWDKTDHHIFCQDSLTLLSELPQNKVMLTYIDPPYNHRQYASNYHILETIARWDLAAFEPRGITGLREKEENISVYCQKRKAFDAFDALFMKIASPYILFSYNNEGILSETELRRLFKTHFEEIVFKKIRYARYRSDINHANRTYKSDKTYEYLIFAKKKNHVTIPGHTKYEKGV